MSSLQELQAEMERIRAELEATKAENENLQKSLPKVAQPFLGGKDGAKVRYASVLLSSPIFFGGSKQLTVSTLKFVLENQEQIRAQFAAAEELLRQYKAKKSTTAS